ncbi:MAG TPA: GNAT family N-acetyltransferase [Flavilitoribacter sp.]|nr:GNAT family N-acetyltransferase [Flavilitoribacter sp.]HMQ87115.1 GNAT family N-acetyltransferase [Flavilitoribacter sp.]
MEKGISVAVAADIPQIVRLLNSAYRGEGSKTGWSTEADLLDGSIRTDEANVRSLMLKEHAVFLKYTESDGSLQGCVYLDNREGSLYLGMLSVNPQLQAKGIGKQLLAAAEQHARLQQCSSVFMQVINARTELMDWYIRHGYQRTGEVFPFNGDHRFGAPNRPLFFEILEKRLS